MYKYFVKSFDAIIIVISFIFWLIFGFSLYSVYTTYSALGGSLSDLIYIILSNSIVDGTSLCLLLLISVSVFFLMGWMNYDLNLRLHGIASVLFIYVTLVLLFCGMIMLSLPTEPNVVILNSTSVTKVNFIYSNSSDPLNFSHILPSYEFANINESRADNMSIPNSPQNEAIKKLGSGVFGNGIGIIGIALALFGLFLTNLDKIQTSVTPKSMVTNYQIKTLAMIWIIGALIIDLVMLIHIKIIAILPNLVPISLFTYGFLIEIIGLILLIYGYYKSKESHSDPPSEPAKVEPPKESFEEIVNRIHKNLTKKNL